MHPLIPSRWQIPDEFHRRLGEKAGKQRAMVAQNHLLLVLHKLPRPGVSEREARLFWRDPSGGWQESEGGGGIAELNEHLNSFERATDELEALFRSAPSAESYFTVLNRATPLLRTVRNLHNTLQHAREAVPGDRHLVLARDSSGEIERTLELLHSDALHGLQFLAAARAEEQASTSHQLVATSHRLNLIIALFLPLTALASLLGMNIRNGLEDVGPVGFFVVLLLGAILGASILVLVNRPVAKKRAQPVAQRKPTLPRK
jgi:hypothetical protein